MAFILFWIVNLIWYINILLFIYYHFLQRENWKNFRQELADTAFLKDFSQLLEDYGYRAVNELEAASVRWGEDPSYVFDQILTMVKLKREEGIESPESAKEKR